MKSRDLSVVFFPPLFFNLLQMILTIKIKTNTWILSYITTKMTFHGGTFMAHKISMPLKNSKEDRYNLYAVENIN